MLGIELAARVLRWDKRWIRDPSYGSIFLGVVWNSKISPSIERKGAEGGEVYLICIDGFRPSIEREGGAGN